jgi:hypothetical protein
VIDLMCLHLSSPFKLDVAVKTKFGGPCEYVHLWSTMEVAVSAFKTARAHATSSIDFHFRYLS